MSPTYIFTTKLYIMNFHLIRLFVVDQTTVCPGCVAVSTRRKGDRSNGAMCTERTQTYVYKPTAHGSRLDTQQSCCLLFIQNVNAQTNLQTTTAEHLLQHTALETNGQPKRSWEIIYFYVVIITVLL